MPLNGNTLPYVPPAASTQQQIAAINRIIDIINAFQQSIVFSDGTNKRMLIGYQKDGWGPGKDFGIKISKEGSDVASASDEQLVFKMDIDTWFWNTADGINFAQLGKLPDETYGLVTAIPGANVSEAF